MGRHNKTVKEGMGKHKKWREKERAKIEREGSILVCTMLYIKLGYEVGRTLSR